MPSARAFAAVSNAIRSKGVFFHIRDLRVKENAGSTIPTPLIRGGGGEHFAQSVLQGKGKTRSDSFCTSISCQIYSVVDPAGHFTMTDNQLQQNPESASGTLEPIYAADLPDECPPKDAKRETVVFHAAHRDNPPSDLDITTAWQRNAFPKAPECERKSNSVMTDEQDAKHLLKLAPTRYRFVSRGTIAANHGVWKHSATKNHPSHHSLWVFRGVRMKDIFTVSV
jgi:hypothetical protein